MDDLIVFGRMVGRVIGKALLTQRNSKKHFFRKYKGYALSILTIEAAKERGAEKVQIELTDKGETLVAPFSLFYEKGIDYADQNGHDKQKVLPLEYWEIFKDKK